MFWVISLLLDCSYHRNPKNSETRKIYGNHPKILTKWLYHRVMHQKDTGGIANSVDPDQTARSSLIWVCTVCPSLAVRKLRIITVKQGLRQGDVVLPFLFIKFRMDADEIVIYICNKIRENKKSIIILYLRPAFFS